MPPFMAGRKQPAAQLGLGAGEPLEERVRRLIEGRFGLDPAARHAIALRIVGPRELESDGPEALRRHRLEHSATPVLAIVPPHATASLVRECFRAGAADVIDDRELDPGLLYAVERAISDASAAPGDDTGSLARHARELEDDLQRLQQGYDETLAAFVRALDLRERETTGHSHRVALYSLCLGMRLGLDGEELESLYRGALLHDLGKLGIPEALLLKPQTLCDADQGVLKSHAQVGADMVRSVAFLREASDIAHWHHEAWDGSGYPAGLAARDIPLHARIFAVVDRYEALRRAPSPDAAPLDRLRSEAGRRLDPELVEAFVAIAESTWKQLDSLASGKHTFAAALETCRAVSVEGVVS